MTIKSAINIQKNTTDYLHKNVQMTIIQQNNLCFAALTHLLKKKKLKCTTEFTGKSLQLYQLNKTYQRQYCFV